MNTNVIHRDNFNPSSPSITNSSQVAGHDALPLPRDNGNDITIKSAQDLETQNKTQKCSCDKSDFALNKTVKKYRSSFHEATAFHNRYPKQQKDESVVVKKNRTGYSLKRKSQHNTLQLVKKTDPKLQHVEEDPANSKSCQTLATDISTDQEQYLNTSCSSNHELKYTESKNTSKSQSRRKTTITDAQISHPVKYVAEWLIIQDNAPPPEASEKLATPGTILRIRSSVLSRGSWGRPLEFILACLGYAVGLGNVWRFPYLCYRNGGGAFLIPFILMLILIGLPLFYLELYIGQYTRMGPLKAFTAIAPFFTGLGYCTLVVITIIQIYYMIIVAWTLFYTLVSITGNIEWGSCENDYNTNLCYSGEYDSACRMNNTGSASDLTYYLKTCMSIGDICIANGYQPYDGMSCLKGTERVPWYTNVTRKLASEEYYNERVLGRGNATWENWGTIQWHLVGTLFLSWLIAFFCAIKGVQSAGKVVYFTALFPYVMLTALLIRGVTLDGAMDGIVYYLSPQWDILMQARVWGDAASQIFYSFGVACGSLITLASYNDFYNNCHFDASFVSFANFGTSIYAGFAIFSVLGFQARQMKVKVDDVAEQGPGLAFVAYPEALLQMPAPALWSTLFFFMLFILGLGSQFAGIEAINTAITDRWPRLRKHYWRVTAVTCFSCFILGLPMCFSGGVYLFTLLDWNTASWAILLIGMTESVAVSWCYGIQRAMKDLASMGMTFNKCLRTYWMAVWTFIVPIGSIGILAFIFYDWSAPEFEGYVFPVFASALGWVVGLSTLILFPVGVIWAYYYKGYRGKALFSPTPAWKSSMEQPPSAQPVSHITSIPLIKP